MGKLYGRQAQAPLIHSLFQRFAELMSRISRNPVDFKATRICGWLGWVFRARRLVVDRQVRHFRAPTRFKCMRFGFTIFLSAFYFVVFIFLLFFLFFLHNFRLALKVSVHVAERPQLTSAFLHYLYEARYSMWASQPIHYVYIYFLCLSANSFWFSVFLTEFTFLVCGFFGKRFNELNTKVYQSSSRGEKSHSKLYVACRFYYLILGGLNSLFYLINF